MDTYNDSVETMSIMSDLSQASTTSAITSPQSSSSLQKKRGKETPCILKKINHRIFVDISYILFYILYQ